MWKYAAIGGLVVACVLGGVLAFWWDSHERNPSRATVEEAWVVDGKLIAIEEFSVQTSDLDRDVDAVSVVDLATGKRLARVRIPSEMALVAAIGDGLWFYDAQQGLHRRDAKTLAVEVKQADWAKDLKVQGVPGVKDGVIQVLDDQGRAWWLDPATLAVTPATLDYDLPEPPSLVHESPYTDGAYDHDRLITWEGTPRAGLRCGRDGEVSKDTLLAPYFLRTATDDHGIWLRDPDGALAVFASSLGPTAPFELARVPCQGPPAWTTTLPAGPLQAVVLARDTVTVLVDPSGGDTLVQVGLADGAVRWTYKY